MHNVNSTKSRIASFLALIIGLSLLPAASAADDWDIEQQYLDRARAVLSEVPLIDGHNDLPWQFRRRVNYDFDAIDITQDTSTFDPPIHTDIPRLRDGQLGAQFWSVYVRPGEYEGFEAVQATHEQIDFVYRMIERYPDTFEFAYTADEVESIFADGRIPSLLGMEGGHSINDSLAMLRNFHRLGVRYMTLTHGDNTAWADSATDDPEHNGLTSFGEEVVREMNRLGMLVDLSHVSEDTMHDALDVTEAPVIFSHSSARGVIDHPRNVPDDVLERLAENNGVIMITFVPSFVAEQDATLAHVADHIDHVRDTVGIEYIGIGGDYDGIRHLPQGLEDVSTYPYLFAELAERGYSDEQLRKIAGLNVLRVMREAEEVAERMDHPAPAKDPQP